MLLRGLWAIVPGRWRSSRTQWTSSQSSRARSASRRAGVDVGRALGDVDVDTDAEIGGQAGSGGERVVGAREGGVDADQTPSAGAQEALVLGQAAAGAVGAVAVGHAVRADDAHADLGAGVGDDVEAALDGRRALVVVDDRRRAGEQRLQRAEAGRGAQHVEVQGGVEAPPDLLEDLGEVVRRGRRRRHAAGQRRVEVVVPADEAGGDGAHRSARDASYSSM